MEPPAASLSVGAFLNTRLELRQHIVSELANGEPLLWRRFAALIQRQAPSITADWVRDIQANHPHNHALQSEAFLDRYCQFQQATVDNLMCSLREVGLERLSERIQLELAGIAHVSRPAEKLDEAALACKEAIEVGTKRGLAVDALPEVGASKARRADVTRHAPSIPLSGSKEQRLASAPEKSKPSTDRQESSSSASSDEVLVLFTTSGISLETEGKERSVIVERVGEDCVSRLRALTTKNLHEIIVRDGDSLRIWHFSGAGDVEGQLQVLHDDKRGSCFLAPDMVYQQLKIAQMASSDELLFDYAFLNCRQAASANALQNALRPFCRGIIGWRGDPRQYGVRFASDFYSTIAFFRSKSVEITNRHIKRAVKHARQQLPNEVKNEPFFEVFW